MRTTVKTFISAILFSVIVGTGAIAADKRVKVINESDHTILRVQATNINDTSYGEVLNQSPIAPGDWEVIDLDDGAATCLYDIRAQQRGGYETTSRIDACRSQTWTIVP